MVVTIMLSVVKRKWRPIAFAVVQTSMMAKMVLDFRPSTDIWAIPMALAWFLTIPPGPMLQMREHYQLPVSRRSWWLVRWWLSTGGGTIISAMAMSFALWAVKSQLVSIESLVMFSALSFLYCGLQMAVLRTPFGQSGDEPIQIAAGGETDRAAIKKATAQSLPTSLVLMLASIAAPFFFAKYLPHTFAAINLATVAALAPAIAIAVWGFVYHPALKARPIGRVLPEARTAIVEREQRQSRYNDRLTGLRLAFWIEGRRGLATYSAVVVALILGWLAVSTFRDMPPLSEFLRNIDALPFSNHRAQITEFLTWGFLLFITTTIDGVTITSVRSLRTLPLTATELSCLPVVLGVLSALMLWVVLIALHVVVLVALPMAPRADLFLAFGGFVALSHVLRLSVPGEVYTKGMIGFAPLLVIMLIGLFASDSWNPATAQPVMLLTGVSLMALSFFVMRYAVTRGSGIYRQRTAGVRL